jgi:ABC-type transport system involved in cytochrome bd biosynthesis fused ATPase/permease subunit
MAMNLKDETPFGVKWDWDESRNCLTYKAYTHVQLNFKLIVSQSIFFSYLFNRSTNNSEKNDKKKKSLNKNNKLRDAKIDLRSGAPRLITQNREKQQAATPYRTEKKVINSHVALSDIMSERNFTIKIINSSKAQIYSIFF